MCNNNATHSYSPVFKIQNDHKAKLWDRSIHTLRPQASTLRYSCCCSEDSLIRHHMSSETKGKMGSFVGINSFFKSAVKFIQNVSRCCTPGAHMVPTLLLQKIYRLCELHAVITNLSECTRNSRGICSHRYVPCTSTCDGDEKLA